MNKKYLLIGIAIVILVGLFAAAQIMNAPSAMTINSKKDKKDSSSSMSVSSITSSQSSTTGNTGGNGGGSSATSSNPSSGSSSSCAYECCSNADCVSADGLAVCNTDSTGNYCQLSCDTPAGGTVCENSGGNCNTSGQCEQPCGSGFCPLGSTCVNDVSCAPLPPVPQPPADDQ